MDGSGRREPGECLLDESHRLLLLALTTVGTKQNYHPEVAVLATIKKIKLKGNISYLFRPRLGKDLISDIGEMSEEVLDCAPWYR